MAPKRLYLKKAELIKKNKKEMENNKRISEMHNKYLPKYLSPKIINAVGFIEYIKERGKLDMKSITKFLSEEKRFSQKEINWVLMLLSFEAIEEILSTPEVNGLIKIAINKTKTTLH